MSAAIAGSREPCQRWAGVGGLFLEVGQHHAMCRLQQEVERGPETLHYQRVFLRGRVSAGAVTRDI